MSGKKLKTGPVMNELKGQSAFFNQPKPPIDSPKIEGYSNHPPGKANKSEPIPKNDPKTNERTEIVFERTSERPNVRSNERFKIRHTFDIFKDQLQELHSMQLKFVQSGGKKPKLGEMVQEALDLYFEVGLEGKHTSERTVEPSDERTNDQI